MAPETDPSRTAAAPRRRSRKTSARVIWTDRVTTATITFGGAGVILAVLGILVYLVIVVWPLFGGASVEPLAEYSLHPPEHLPHVLFTEVDEYRVLGVSVTRSGEAMAFAARSGRRIATQKVFVPAAPLTAFRRTARGGHVAFGFADGTVRLGRIGFETSFLSPGEAAALDPPMDPGEIRETEGAVLERAPGGEIRRVSLEASMEASIDPEVRPGEAASPIRLIDYRTVELGNDARFAVLDAAGELQLNEAFRRENFLTGEISTDLRSTRIPYPAALASLGEPLTLLLASQGDQLYLAWRDGTLARYDLRDPKRASIAERTDIVPEPAERLTSLRFMLGEQSLLAGDSSGRVRAWFRVSRDGANEDGYALVAAHTLAPTDSAVRVLAVSLRDKTLAAGTEGGRIDFHHMTSEQVLASIPADPPSSVVSLQITPKSDGLFAVTADGRARLWDVRNPHPETTLGSIFGSVWYEGYPEASYTWQSSSATDDFEPKFSLIPLIFGTLKATLYSMLFAVPIALLAAIYTSEFLDRRLRGPLKSAIEIMASLPSVVLGFIAALVLAPIVENWVIAILLVFAVVPVSALAFGYLWQIVPRRAGAAIEGRGQIVLLALVVILSLFFSVRLAGPVESLMFGGDFKAWLDGRAGSGAPGIGLLAWPVLIVGLLFVDRRFLADRIDRRLSTRSRAASATAQAVKFGALVGASILLAWAVGLLGAALGFDPRGELFGTYVQRNALVVGFVMGFAVIPIIYTIAEDALSAVPESLRSASLGCGATRWQTATRVILPVAASGIFSALMVGLGRAVGETMIVLMAAGNTPLLDFNLFNGLRTLSANIAVELPEAVKDGTLYRMLFLSALTLFVLTSIVNTIAEIIRQRFRKRAYQL